MKKQQGKGFLFGMGALIVAAVGFVVGVIAIGEKGLRLLPSTRRMWRRMRENGYPLFERLHAYGYGTFPYHYIGLGIRGVPEPMARLLDKLPFMQGEETGSIADTYHGKVVPLQEATRFVTIDREISLRVPEAVVPFERARDIIIENPDHIVAFDCPCRMAHEDPCLPLDVCLIIGEPFANYALEHHPKHARPITQQEAVDILHAEDARGHVHHVFFKEAMMDRFYAICNCCSCCCGAMQAQRNGAPMLISSGLVAYVDPALCQGCGNCVSYCQFQAITVMDGLAAVDAAACMGCGVCTSKCPQDAIRLVDAPDRGVPLEIEKLMALAA